MTPSPTETELLARILMRGCLQIAKGIAALYGWSIRDENDNLLREQAPAVPVTATATLQIGEVRIVRKLKID